MRIVIDVQGTQSGSRTRGIGRYSASLATALLEQHHNTDIVVLCNRQLATSDSSFLDSIARVANRYRTDLIYFNCAAPVAAQDPANRWRRIAAEILREDIISQLYPDVVITLSLFEGYIDNAVTSIGRRPSPWLNAVVLYDLIPLSDPAKYLADPASANWYYEKLESLKRADTLLAISDSAKCEAEKLLDISHNKLHTIYSAADERFSCNACSQDFIRNTLQVRGINRPYLMHASAYEPRKNFEGLLQAFAALPISLRQQHQLVFVAAIPVEGQSRLRHLAHNVGLRDDDLIFAGHVTDEELVALYTACKLFVFPPFHEGFGLPALEAMKCGCPTIGSNATSIPEVIGRQDALFNPHDPLEISRVIEQVLVNQSFFDSLREHATTQASRFSWSTSASLAWTAIETCLSAKDFPKTISQKNHYFAATAIANLREGSPSESDLKSTANAAARNRLEAHRVGKRFSSLTDKALDPDPREAPQICRIPFWHKDAKIRILILKLDHAGDLLTSLPAAKQLRTCWPNADITLVCGPWNQGFARQTGLFNSVHSCSFFPEKGSEYNTDAITSHGPAAFGSLHLLEYDLAIDLRYYPDTRHLLNNVTATVKAGFTGEDIPLDISLPGAPEHSYAANSIARSCALVSLITNTLSPPNLLDLPICLASERSYFSASRGLPLVGLCLSTGNPIKAWPSHHITSLVRALIDSRKCQVVLLGGPSEQPAAREICARIASDELMDLCGRFAWEQLPSVFRDLDLYVGFDTGTTHMAAMLGIRTICLFSGQSHFATWHPRGTNVTTIRQQVPCSPCYLVHLADCPHQHACMQIDPKVVESYILESLDVEGDTEIVAMESLHRTHRER